MHRSQTMPEVQAEFNPLFLWQFPQMSRVINSSTVCLAPSDKKHQTQHSSSPSFAVPSHWLGICPSDWRWNSWLLLKLFDANRNPNVSCNICHHLPQESPSCVAKSAIERNFTAPPSSMAGTAPFRPLFYGYLGDTSSLSRPQIS